MAITFPITDLLTRGDVITKGFDAVSRQSISRTAGGALLAYDFGVSIWKGSYVSAVMSHDDCIDLEARLQALEGAVGTFYGMDTRRMYPRAYPTGSFTDSGTVTSLGVDGKSMSIANLPANFVINRGDYFQITVSGVPQLYRAVELKYANGSGISGTFGVLPHYDPAMTTGLAVVFKQPACLMRLEPGSVQFNDTGRALGTVAFTATQI